MLKPIQRPRKDRALLVPDYLLVMNEPDTKQAIKYFPRKPGSVPHIGDLEARDESKASDQSARVSPEIEVSVWPTVRCFM